MLKRVIRDEKGNVLILVLILLVVGGLILGPLLGLMGTGLVAGQVYEKKTAELYAADAGVEDALYNVMTDTAPYYQDLRDLDVEDSFTYTIADPTPINGISPVTITLTKLSLLAGLVDESEYKIGQPHEGWITFDTPVETDRTEAYVEYGCTVSFNYTGKGNRELQKVGTFFLPYTGAAPGGPYEVNYMGAMTDDNLVDITAEMVAGGIHFIWEWEQNSGPGFDTCHPTGSIHYKFKVYDSEWEYSLRFVYALVKEQDISFVTDAPGSFNWLIKADAGNTEVRSAAIQLSEEVRIVTWQVSSS